MGSTCVKCFKIRPKKQISLLLLGLDNAGKTEVAHRLFKITRTEFLPTAGCKVYESNWGGYRVSLSEIGGAPNIRSIWKYYLLEAFGIIFVIDSSDIDRLEEGKKMLKKLLSNPHLEGKPVLVLGNKQDLSGTLDYVDICYYFELSEMANNFRNPCMLEVTGLNDKENALNTAFCWILSTIHQRYNLIKNTIKFYENHTPENPLRPITSRPSRRIKRNHSSKSFIQRPKTAPMNLTSTPTNHVVSNATKKPTSSVSVISNGEIFVPEKPLPNAPQPPPPVIVTTMAAANEEYSSDNQEENIEVMSSVQTKVQVHRVDEKSPNLRVNSSNGPLNVSHPASMKNQKVGNGNGVHLSGSSDSKVPNNDIVVEDLSLETIPNGNI